MKDFNEMAQSVLERRDRYVAERDRKRKRLAAELTCLCLVGLVGVGAWQANTPKIPDSATGGVMPGGVLSEGDFEGGGINYGESYQVGTTERDFDDTEKWEIAQKESVVIPYTEDEPAQGTEEGEAVTVGNWGDPFYGGSYWDGDGNFVVLLTENTKDVQEKVLSQYFPSQTGNIIFREAKFSLAYLELVQTQISEKMRAGELTAVIESAVMESQNRVTVTLTTYDEEQVERIQEADFLGGAIEIVCGIGNRTENTAE